MQVEEGAETGSHLIEIAVGTITIIGAIAAFARRIITGRQAMRESIRQLSDGLANLSARHDAQSTRVDRELDDLKTKIAGGDALRGEMSGKLDKLTDAIQSMREDTRDGMTDLKIALKDTREDFRTLTGRIDELYRNHG